MNVARIDQLTLTLSNSTLMIFFSAAKIFSFIATLGIAALSGLFNYPAPSWQCKIIFFH